VRQARRRYRSMGPPGVLRIRSDQAISGTARRLERLALERGLIVADLLTVVMPAVGDDAAAVNHARARYTAADGALGRRIVDLPDRGSGFTHSASRPKAPPQRMAS
jgi:hypothetical protein